MKSPYEDAEYEDAEHEEYESEPSDDADDNEEDTENFQDNQSVALASTQLTKSAEPAQPALSSHEGATENTGHLTADGTQVQSPPEPITVDTSLPVATEPIYGIPDPNRRSPCSYWARCRVMLGLRSWLPCAGGINRVPL